MENCTVVYILGSGHCGSTLLNLLLNGHSEITGLSEIKNLHLSPYSSLTEKEFWSHVTVCCNKRSNVNIADVDLTTPVKSFKKLLFGKIEKDEVEIWLQENRCILTCVSIVSGNNIIVDSSKEWQRLLLLRKIDNLDIKVIHLIRDGRAVINSYKNKYGSFRVGWKRWLKNSIYAIILNKFFFDSWLTVRYEDVATTPEKEMIKICSFLGVRYSENMLNYRSHEYVGIGGNRMIQKDSEKIYLDDKWKEQLDNISKIKFNVLGLLVNKYFGY